MAFQRPVREFEAFAVSPSGRLMIKPLNDSPTQGQLWDLQLNLSIGDPFSCVARSVQFGMNEMRLLALGADGRFRHLDTVTGQVLATYFSGANYVPQALLGPDGQRVIARVERQPQAWLAAGIKARRFHCRAGLSTFPWRLTANRSSRLSFVRFAAGTCRRCSLSMFRYATSAPTSFAPALAPAATWL